MCQNRLNLFKMTKPEHCSPEHGLFVCLFVCLFVLVFNNGISNG